VLVHSNGYLEFGPGDGNSYYQNDAIPSVDIPNNCIYAMWRDLNPGSAGDIYTKVEGSAPNRRFIAEWTNVTQYQANNSNNFQVVLFEGSSNIELRYGACAAMNGATVGIENSDGTVAHSVASGTLGTGNTVRTVTNVPATNVCPPPCGTSDFNGDGDFGTDQDIEAFFRVLAGGNC
jgi:hypothetical protein